MHVLVFVIWIVSLVLFAFEALRPRPFNVLAFGLFAFDLWIGLHFVLEVTDPLTF